MYLWLVYSVSCTSNKFEFVCVCVCGYNFLEFGMYVKGLVMFILELLLLLSMQFGFGLAHNPVIAKREHDG